MEKIKITLDAGHGGNDRYNTGYNGYVEADGALDITLRLKKKLLSTGVFEVKLTRANDVTVGIRTRGIIAANNGADMLISNHTNANDGKTRGTEVFRSVDLQDYVIASEMSKAISEVLGVPNRGSKLRESKNYPGEDYYGIIDSAQDRGVPHILLIESAFHDNKSDCAILNDSAKRDLIAETQCKVICDFYNVIYPVVNSVEKEGISMEDLRKILGIKDASWATKQLKLAKENDLIQNEHDTNEVVTMGLLLTIMNNLYSELKEDIEEAKKETK